METPCHITLNSAHFDPAQEAALFRERNAAAGAIVSFTGQVRSENGAVAALKIDHYPGYTESAIRDIAESAYVRWRLDAVAIRHRVGEMAPGDAIVFVATAAPHRRAAFEAADYLMDYLKSEAPFWKQETRNGEARWVEPCAQDIKEKTRWREPQWKEE